MPPARIPGLSVATAHAIGLLEREEPGRFPFRGAVARALRRYAEFVAAPGRAPLYPEPYGCNCDGCRFDDVRYARAMIESALDTLTGRARAELARAVAPLDARYLERTIPNPFAVPAGVRWWHRRLELHGPGVPYDAWRTLLSSMESIQGLDAVGADHLREPAAEVIR